MYDSKSLYILLLDVFEVDIFLFDIFPFMININEISSDYLNHLKLKTSTINQLVLS